MRVLQVCREFPMRDRRSSPRLVWRTFHSMGWSVRCGRSSQQNLAPARVHSLAVVYMPVHCWPGAEASSAHTGHQLVAVASLTLLCHWQQAAVTEAGQ